jgi:phosphopantetheinyl transferase
MLELVTTRRLAHETVVGVISLPEMDGCPGLEETFLTPHEIGLVRAFKDPKRKREWLGARVCLKTLLLKEGLVADPLRCEVGKDERGRPRLLFFSDPGPKLPPDCSLSHKDDYALAALSTEAGIKLGADLERISPRLARLCSRFINNRDRLLPLGGQETRAAALWAMKEAASKAAGEGLKIGLSKLVCMEKETRMCLIRRPQGPAFEAAYVLLKGYVAAVAWAVKSPD